MKKLSVILAMLLICATLCSCGKGYDVYVEGIENFDETEGYVEINVYLLPSKDFLKIYPYTFAQYNHKEMFKNRLSIVATESSLVVVNYEPEIYEQAKNFCLQKMNLINSFEYGSFVFAEEISLAIGQDRIKEDNTMSYPGTFNMFAYNDDNCCLMFLGASIQDGIKENTKKDPVLWDEIWEKYFSEFYSIAD